MAANSWFSEVKLEIAKLHLQTLKAPRSTLTLSTYQKQVDTDRIRGRELWGEVLKAYHEEQSPTSSGNGPFGTSFLDLPPELRNIIYTLCLEDDKKLRKGRERARDKCCNP